MVKVIEHMFNFW